MQCFVTEQENIFDPSYSLHVDKDSMFSAWNKVVVKWKEIIMRLEEKVMGRDKCWWNKQNLTLPRFQKNKH